METSKSRMTLPSATLSSPPSLIALYKAISAVIQVKNPDLDRMLSEDGYANEFLNRYLI